MGRGATRWTYEKDQAEHRRRWCGSPGRSHCPKALACDRPAPTTGHRASGRDRLPAYGDSCVRQLAHLPEDAEMQGWHTEARPGSGPATPDFAFRRDLRAADSATGHAE